MANRSWSPEYKQVKPLSLSRGNEKAKKIEMKMNRDHFAPVVTVMVVL